MYILSFYMQPLNSLESTDEDKLVDILQRLRSEVKTRGLLLYPYFRDFDKVSYMFMANWSVNTDTHICIKDMLINSSHSKRSSTRVRLNSYIVYGHTSGTSLFQPHEIRILIP